MVKWPDVDGMPVAVVSQCSCDQCWNGNPKCCWTQGRLPQGVGYRRGAGHTKARRCPSACPVWASPPGLSCVPGTVLSPW